MEVKDRIEQLTGYVSDLRKSVNTGGVIDDTDLYNIDVMLTQLQEQYQLSQLMPSDERKRLDDKYNLGWGIFDEKRVLIMDSIINDIIKQSQPKKEGEKLLIKCEGCSCPFPDHCIYQKEKCEAPEGYGCSYIQSKDDTYINKSDYHFSSRTER